MSPTHEIPEAADAVVVGGGIMGTSTAYFLTTETDLEVVLLEKDNIASGSTGDSSAIIRHHYGEQRIYTELVAWSHEFYRNFEERTGERIAYEQSPRVRFAEENTPGAEYADAGYEILTDLEIPVSRFERAELEAEYPMLELDGVDFAVSDDTAAYSDGSDVAGGFARAAQDRGATVLTGTGVTDIRSDGGAVTGVETDAGTIATDAVVLTVGPWTPAFVEKFGYDLPIETTREQVLILDPGDEFRAAYPENVPTTSPPDEPEYLRPDFGGNILIATHYTGSVVDPDDYEETPDETTILDLLSTLESFVPELSDAKLKGQYCGVYSTTPDHDFIIDELGPSGCLVGCGFSGHGFKHGPAVGKILSDLTASGTTALTDVDRFSIDRFEGVSGQ
jgi:glycine/D-amino acid oxidase-like deaminating enzyme